jgi:tellurite resistance-related uncharacterized protein
MFIDRGPALPDGAWAYRTIGPFAADTIPAGLLRMHNLKAGAWGVLTVEAGAVCVFAGTTMSGAHARSRRVMRCSFRRWCRIISNAPAR